MLKRAVEGEDRGSVYVGFSGLGAWMLGGLFDAGERIAESWVAKKLKAMEIHPDYLYPNIPRRRVAIVVPTAVVATAAMLTLMFSNGSFVWFANSNLTTWQWVILALIAWIWMADREFPDPDEAREAARKES